MNPLTTIIIPSRNEEENIGILIDEIHQYLNNSTDILVVDDSDNDLTLKEAIDHGAIGVKGKRNGLAGAVIYGIELAQGENIIVMDADLQHPPEILPRVIDELKIHDLVVVTKHAKGTKQDLTLMRKVYSQLGVWSARMLVPISDPMTGFFGFRKNIIDGIELNPIGFKIGLEIFCKGNWISHSEVPMHFRARNKGVSKGVANSLQKHLWQLYKESRSYKLPAVPGSEEWEAFFEGNWMRKKWKQEIAKVLRTRTGMFEVEKLLDVGCGSSPNIMYMKAKEKTGIDVNKDAINFISNRLDNIEFRIESGLNINEPNEKFDCVTCIEVIEHMKDDEANTLMNELARVTSHNGHVIIATPNYNSLLWNTIETSQKILQPGSWTDDHYTKLNRNKLAKLAWNSGLEVLCYDSVVANTDMIMTFYKN